MIDDADVKLDTRVRTHIRRRKHEGDRVIFYDYYDVPRREVDRFVDESELGRLVTVNRAGDPHIGLYPFVYIPPERIELHLNADDEQLADLQENRRCVFEVDELLAVVPSYWIDDENAVMATAYHRTVVFDCHATVTRDGEAMARQQTRLLNRYQPEGRYRALAATDPMYAGMIEMLAAVQLDVTRCRAKFKLGQNRAPHIRAQVAELLRGRGRFHDQRAAEGLEWTMQTDPKRSWGDGHM